MQALKKKVLVSTPENVVNVNYREMQRILIFEQGKKDLVLITDKMKIHQALMLKDSQKAVGNGVSCTEISCLLIPNN